MPPNYFKQAIYERATFVLFFYLYQIALNPDYSFKRYRFTV